MCETTPDTEWTPYTLFNLNWFPKIDTGTTTYAVMEYCPDCRETRARIVDPSQMKVVNDAGGEDDISTTSVHQSDGSEETVTQPSDGSENVGRDLDRPEDI